MSRYIDAEAYKAAHKNAYESAMMECGNGDDTKLARRVYEAVIKSVDVFPAADVQEVRHGRWVTLDDEYIDECKCSSCGVYEYFNKGWKRFNYCPNCGSRMDSDGDAE